MVGVSTRVRQGEGTNNIRVTVFSRAKTSSIDDSTRFSVPTRARSSSANVSTRVNIPTRICPLKYSIIIENAYTRYSTTNISYYITLKARNIQDLGIVRNSLVDSDR